MAEKKPPAMYVEWEELVTSLAEEASAVARTNNNTEFLDDLSMALYMAYHMGWVVGQELRNQPYTPSEN